MGRMIPKTRGTRQPSRAVVVYDLDDEPPKRSAVWRGARMVLLWVMVPLALLVAIGAAVLYARLAQGPISSPFLARAIGEGLSAELNGVQAIVGGAQIARRGEGIALYLTNVQIRDRNGHNVGVAPTISVGLSGLALMRGRIVPSRITLLQPSLRLRQSEDGRLSISFSTAPATSAAPQSQPAQPGGQTAPQDGAVPHAVPLATQKLDVPAALNSLLARSDDTRSFFRSLAIKNAVVWVERTGRAPVRVNVSTADLELSRGAQPVLTARAVIGTGGPGRARALLAIKRDEDDQSAYALSVSADGIDRGLLAILGITPASSGVSVAKSNIKGRLKLSSDAELIGGRLAIALENLSVPGQPTGKTPLVRSADVHLSFTRNGHHIDLAPSRINFEGGHVTLIGAVTRETRDAAPGRWRFAFSAADGQFTTEGRGRRRFPVGLLRVEGAYDTARLTLQLRRVSARLGGAAAEATGFLSLAPGRRSQIKARIGGVRHELVGALWPSTIAPDARAWFRANMISSGPASGEISLVRSDAAQAQPAAGPLGRWQVYLDMTAAEINASPFLGMPSVHVPKAVVRFAGGALDISASTARMTVGRSGTVQLKNLRYIVAQALTAQPRARLTFDASAPLSTALAALSDKAIAILPPEAARFKAGGTARANLAIDLPPEITKNWRSQIKVTGEASVTDGAISGAPLPHPITRANISVALKKQLLLLRGKFLASGVPTNISWQRLQTERATEQPPMRITLSLNDAQRRRLDLGSDAIVRFGITPVEITIRDLGLAGVTPKMHVNVDLTGAELAVDSLSWRKPAGTKSQLGFDVTKGKTYPVRLDNLRLTGEGLAVEGWAGLAADNTLVNVTLPTFSLGASRLSMTAARHQPDPKQPAVWRVSVEGPFYDGTDFFRSLFSAGKTQSKSAEVQLGLDLTAKIEAVSGFHDARLTTTRITLSKRAGRIAALTADGRLDGGGTLRVVVRTQNGQPRRLVATSNDAGNVFRLVDFYPSARGGDMRLTVDLDGSGAAERTGVLTVRDFKVLGDPVITEVVRTSEDGRPEIARNQTGRNRVVREVVLFDLMHAPFSVGHGQFVLRDAQLRGPLFGASLRGKADYARRRLNLGGTYAPLQGLNAAFRVLPGIGQILTGPRGEGIVGMTFAVKGPMESPEVLINPLSLAAPGIFREIFQMSPLTPQVTPRGRVPKPPSAVGRKPQTAPSAQPATPRADRRPQPQRAERAPTIIGDWTAKTRKAQDRTPFERD